MKTCTSAVEVSHLRKTYGTLVAVDDVSVSVAEGEIFGVLGPNDAGKTTAIGAGGYAVLFGFLAMRFFRWE